MRNKYLIIITVLMAFNLLLVWQVYAGSPDSPGPPEATSSYTLEDLYNWLSAGTGGRKAPLPNPAPRRGRAPCTP